MDDDSNPSIEVNNDDPDDIVFVIS
jgi:hypothetical protein